MSTVKSDHLRLFRTAGSAVLYALIIFTLSSLPGTAVPPLGFDFGDKLLHTVEFGIFGVLLYRAFAGTERPFALTVLTGIAYAASDELHQLLVPGRYCDFLADAAGVVLFAGMLSLAAGFRRKRRERP